MMKILHRLSLLIASFVCMNSVEALPGDIPEFIPSDNVQHFNSVLPQGGEPTAQLLALDWEIQFRAYYDYQGPYDGQLAVRRKIIDDGSGWSQYEYQGIHERHVTNFDLNSKGIVTARHESFLDPGTFESVHLRSAYFAYDHEGRITQEHISDGNKQSRYVKLYYYDSNGRLWESVDPLQRVTQYSYEDSTTIVTPLGSETIARRTYDNGHVVEEQFVTNDQVLSYGYSYDDEGFLTNVIVPGGASIIITRDPYHREVYREYPDGSNVSFAYDDFGRAIHEVHAGTAGDILAEYFREYQGFRVVKETDIAGTVTEFTYDAGGREVTRTTNGILIASSYDALGRLAKEEFNDGSLIEYSHDLLDRLVEKKLIAADGTVAEVETFEYPIFPERVFDDWVYIIFETREEEEIVEELLAVPAELQWMQASLHDQVNAYREEKGHPPLALDPFLTSLCQAHCLAMASGEVEPGHEVGSFELTGIGVAEMNGTYYFTQIFVTPKD